VGSEMCIRDRGYPRASDTAGGATHY
jgi:hypothetical protein